jgi:hypothetical protein
VSRFQAGSVVAIIVSFDELFALFTVREDGAIARLVSVHDYGIVDVETRSKEKPFNGDLVVFSDLSNQDMKFI